MTENQSNVQNQEKDEFLKISLVNQINVKKSRVDPLAGLSDKDIDYKNLELLNKFISERGKIMASRITGISLKNQRKLARAIKRARNLALMSFIAKVE